MTLARATPIDRYLAEQADLSAVERFSRYHDADTATNDDRVYRDLIPLRSPAPGEQYAFEVDLDACTGCKACVTACHSLNGLDPDEAWRSVGMLHGSNGTPYRQTVTTACHHCLDPGCLNGCPANAYTKDDVTGIVSHLDDQCIGCGYCTFMCPYEVPQYNARLGIVRKCDMCQGRLAAGEAPACVQGCPNGAIRIGIVDTEELVGAKATASLVPDAPSSHHTVPTTTYRTTRPRTDLIGADHFALRPAHAHPPLALMLVLTQLSVGAFVVDLLLRTAAGRGTDGLLGPQRRFNAIVALALGLLALGASVFHLGRPLYAFRAVLGIGHSWLSREIAAFGAFAGLATAYAASLLVGAPARIDAVLGPLVAVAGIAGVGCSAMVYVATGRTWWRPRSVAPKFVLSAAVCGLATVMFTMLAAAAAGASGPERLASDVARPIAAALIVLTGVKLAGEAALFVHLRARGSGDLKRTAMLLSGDLQRWTLLRYGAGILGGVILPAVVFALAGTAAPSALALAAVAGASVVALAGGEVTERSLFFRALASPRMPGDVS
jgi:formate dehydrogenase iron-sulfur subunit